MSKTRQSALEYLQSPTKSLWSWNDSGREIVWHDGTTIAFREEIGAIVSRLADSSLPPFTAIVFLLAACRGKIPPAISDSGPLSSDRGGLVGVLNARVGSQAIRQFERIRSFPDSIVRTLDGKVFFVQVILESIRDRSGLDPSEVARGVHEIWTDDELNTEDAGNARDLVTRLVHQIAYSLKDYDAETLLRRKKLGIDRVPAAANIIALPIQERARRFLFDLAGDPEFSGYASLAKDLMAAIRLPMRISEVDDHVFTGNAGLGNRGTLDRLLISELAHDDNTLASRIAMNEALYVHREPPASKPDRQLSVLIDAGIRMWGIPRIVATCATLGLLAGHKGKGHVRVWRSESGSLVEVDLFSREGLESHLSVLDTELDPRRALMVADQTLNGHVDDEFVLITNRSSFESESFCACVGMAKFSTGYILAIDGEGRVQLHRYPWGNPRALSETQVDVERLMELPTEPRISKKGIQSLRDADLPAVLCEKRLPLLMPICSEVSLSVHTESGGLCVLENKRLLKWVGRDRGAVELHNNLPPGKTVWLGNDGEGRTVVVKGRHGNGKMSVVIVPESGAKVSFTQFTGPRTPHFTFLDKNVVLIILHTRIVVCALEDGELLAEFPYANGISWISERYFSSEKGVSFAYWNGTSVEWEDAVSGRKMASESVLLAFDRQGSGAWLLLKDGRVISPTGHEFMKLGFHVSRADSRANGNTLVVLEAASAKYHRVDLESKKSVPLSSERYAASIHRVNPPTRAVQTRFSAIWGSPGEPIRLQKPKGKWIELYVTEKTIRFAEAGLHRDKLEAAKLSFKTQRQAQEMGFSLQVAVWPNGSKAWLDSRGLLHLKSRDVDIPELTITLSQGDVAVWTSEGRMSGPPFYIGDQTNAGLPYVSALLKEFTDRL